MLRKANPCTVEIDLILIIENLKKKAIVDQLVKGGYDPDPVSKWKEAQAKLKVGQVFLVNLFWVRLLLPQDDVRWNVCRS